MAELHDLLPEGTPERALADKYQTVSELAKGYKNLESAQNTHKGRPPSDTASPSEVREFYTKLGAPASPDGYVLPEGVDVLKDARQAAYDSGITGGQWDAITAKIMGAKTAADSERDRETQSRLESWQAASRAEHGEGFDEVVAKADRFYEHYKVEHPDISQVLDPVISHPEVLRMMAGMADSGSHEIPMGGAPAGTPGPESLATQIRTIMASEAFKDPRHPERPDVMRKYKEGMKSLVDQGYMGLSDPKLRG